MQGFDSWQPQFSLFPVEPRPIVYLRGPCLSDGVAAGVTRFQFPIHLRANCTENGRLAQADCCSLFYATRSLIFMFKNPAMLSLTRAALIRSTPSSSISFKSTLISSSHFFQVLQQNILNFSPPPMSLITRPFLPYPIILYCLITYWKASVLLLKVSYLQGYKFETLPLRSVIRMKL